MASLAKKISDSLMLAAANDSNPDVMTHNKLKRLVVRRLQ